MVAARSQDHHSTANIGSLALCQIVEFVDGRDLVPADPADTVRAEWIASSSNSKMVTNSSPAPQNYELTN